MLFSCLNHHHFLLIAALTCGSLLSVVGIVQQEEVCPLIPGCCEEDCCGPNTFWEPPLCVDDPGAPGFNGTHSDTWGPGCVSRLCCDADCCSPGMKYDELAAFCLPTFSVCSTDWKLVGKPIPPTSPPAYFSISVSLSNDGKTIAVAAPAIEAPGDFLGFAQVFRWNGRKWIQRGSNIEAKHALDIPDWQVSLSGDGDVVAVGADAFDGRDGYSGHSRVFEWNGSDWTQRGSEIMGTNDHSCTGTKLSLSNDGTTIAILVDCYAGQVRVLRWNGIEWSQLGKDIMTVARTVSLSSNGNIVGLGATSGIVQVFRWGGNSWEQLGRDMVAPYVSSVSLSSDGLVVASAAAGAQARVFQWNGVTWNQLGQDIRGSWGVAIASDGQVIAVGLPSCAQIELLDETEGYVRAYQWNTDTGTWEHLGSEVFKGCRRHGSSIAMSSDGSVVALGNSGFVGIKSCD